MVLLALRFFFRKKRRKKSYVIELCIPCCASYGTLYVSKCTFLFPLLGMIVWFGGLVIGYSLLFLMFIVLVINYMTYFMHL